MLLAWRRIVPVVLMLLVFFSVGTPRGAASGSSLMHEVHAEDEWVTESRDVTLVVPWSVGFPQWQKWVLWDDGLFTHFYLLWTLGVDYELRIPAVLSVTYPRHFEPGESLPITLRMDFDGSRTLVVRPHIGVGLDVDLLIPVLIQWVWVERFAPKLDFQWEWDFSIGDGRVKTTPGQVSLTDAAQTVADAATQWTGIEAYVNVQNLRLSEAPLGTLASGELKINLFHLLLDLVQRIAGGTPLSLIAAVLDWFFTGALGFESGLVIQPSMSAALDGAIGTPCADLHLGVSEVHFPSDGQEVTFSAQVGDLAKEGDCFSIDVGPLIYSYSMICDWAWYVAVNTQFLGLTIAQNEWRLPLMRFPAVTWQSEPVVERFDVAFHVDEPLRASVPEVSQWTIAVNLEDNSGITQANVEWCVGNAYGGLIPLTNNQGSFAGFFPSLNVMALPVAYRLQVLDGDGEIYVVDDEGRWFGAILPPNGLLLAASFGVPIILVILCSCVRTRRR